MEKLVFVMFSALIIGCGVMFFLPTFNHNNAQRDLASIQNDTQQDSVLIEINNNLSYDKTTKIVYWYFEDGGGRMSTGFMSPYISKDGRYCRYEKGKIMPIEKK